MQNSFFTEELMVNYPKPKSDETYREYRERVNQLVKEGKFTLDGLMYGDYLTYCAGSGFQEGIDCESLIQ